MSDQDLTNTTGTGAGTAAAVQTVQAEDWEKRYKGLQRAYDKLKAEMEKLQADFDQQVATNEELRISTRSAEDLKKSSESRIAALEGEKQGLEQKVRSHELKAERFKVIAAKFPSLVTFEAKGLLPDAQTPEELEQKLTEFQSEITSTVGDSVKNKLSGVTAGVAGTTATQAAKDKWAIYDELVILAGQNDSRSRQRHAELKKQWDEIIESERG